MALTTETIADAAMRILADFGLGDLTMRRLARELGVQPSALYWHVADKQSLFVLLAQRMAAEADSAAGRTSADLRAARAGAVMTYRRVLLAYRESADIVLLAYAHSGPSVLPQSLAELDDELRSIVTPYILGSIAILQNQRLFSTVPPDAGPGGTEGGSGDDAEASFRTGLVRLLAH